MQDQDHITIMIKSCQEVMHLSFIQLFNSNQKPRNKSLSNLIFENAFGLSVFAYIIVELMEERNEDTYQDFCTSKVTKLNLVGERINLHKIYIAS